MNFLETKRAHRDASEYHPNHSHMERGGSKTHPIGPPAASCQHPVLKTTVYNTWAIIIFLGCCVKIVNLNAVKDKMSRI